MSRERPRSQVICAACRSVHTESEWAGLPSITSLAARELSSVVTRWPEGMVVEVHACTCGAALPRLVRARLKTAS